LRGVTTDLGRGVTPVGTGEHTFIVVTLIDVNTLKVHVNLDHTSNNPAHKKTQYFHHPDTNIKSSPF